jgi:hypothetical protein
MKKCADPNFQVQIHNVCDSVTFGAAFKSSAGPIVALVGTMDGKEYMKGLNEHLLSNFRNVKRAIGAPGS